MIYTVEGECIGNAGDFNEHVNQKYGVKITGVSQQNHKRRLMDNQHKINEEWRKKKEGATLAEKIKRCLEQVKKKEVIEHMTDTFYQECEENGVKFFARTTDLFREGVRTKDIPDEEDIEAQMMK